MDNSLAVPRDTPPQAPKRTDVDYDCMASSTLVFEATYPDERTDTAALLREMAKRLAMNPFR